jgi:hypothetical protein
MPATKTGHFFAFLLANSFEGKPRAEPKNYLVISDTCLGRSEPRDGDSEG